jgi:hypothetical protein
LEYVAQYLSYPHIFLHWSLSRRHQEGSSDFFDAFLSQRLLNASVPSQVAADKWVVEAVEPVDTDIVWYKVNATAWSAELDCHPGTIVYDSLRYTSTPNPPFWGLQNLTFSVVISSDGCSASYNEFMAIVDIDVTDLRTG